ncbi:hypothetical protein [Brevundimonas sp.]|uniref:hypothetical protein n=1 Tax=Brevundimonas sp. TaxID=1871086 RepID=UPI001AD1D445|nr:hypothetical protein [Brevundimonas sp.]MBN9466309.1 hypothetical protein [Brevundimonas sp.]
MVSARLLVERGAMKEPSQDWGIYEFLALPSPADRIAVEYEGKVQYLTVFCVHHQPVRTGSDGAAPKGDVVAKWTGSEP